MNRYVKLYLMALASTAALLAVLYWIAYKRMDSASGARGEVRHVREAPFTGSTHELLGSPAITLQQLGRADERLREEERSAYSVRISALRQILLVLGSQNHSVDALRDVFYLYKDDLSEGQREIVDWYLDSGTSLDRKWELAPPVFSLSDFKTILSGHEN